MKILLLSPHVERLAPVMTALGDQIEVTQQKFTTAWAKEQQVDWIVSYGYRHILQANLLDAFPNRVVNLHISLLPWNRGADPNFWSFFDDTPKGVTVHFMDHGIDTGAIIQQRSVRFSPDDTLATSYATLTHMMEQLFAEVWPAIRSGRIQAVPQEAGTGSFHWLRDKTEWMAHLPLGWDTPVRLVEAMGRHSRQGSFHPDVLSGLL